MTAKGVPAVAVPTCIVEGTSSLNWIDRKENADKVCQDCKWFQAHRGFCLYHEVDGMIATDYCDEWNSLRPTGVSEFQIDRKLALRRENCDGYMYAWDNSFAEMERHGWGKPKDGVLPTDRLFLQRPEPKKVWDEANEEWIEVVAEETEMTKAFKRYCVLLEMSSRGSSMMKARPFSVQRRSTPLPDCPVIPISWPDGRFAIAIHPDFRAMIPEGYEIPVFASQITMCKDDVIANKVRALEGASEKDVEDAMLAKWLHHRQVVDGTTHAYEDLYAMLADRPQIAHAEEVQQVKCENLIEQFNAKFSMGYSSEVVADD